MSLINFLVEYKVGGDPVVYKVDELSMKYEINKEGALETTVEFDMHIATEEELEEYQKRNE